VPGTSISSASSVASLANQRKAPTAPGTSAKVAFLMVPPPSRASISAKAPALASMASAISFSLAPRSGPDMRGHGPSSKALRAASMARTESSRPALAISAIGWPVPGSMVVNVSPDWASTYSPLMKSW
jgi:hypothetical protein